MALLDDALGGWGGMVVGFGAAFALPAIVPGLERGMRPVAKTLIRGALAATDTVRELVAETSEQLGDLVAEVRMERAKEKPATRRPTPSPA